MSKPIEPGCLAMIIKSHADNEGKVVNVVRMALPDEATGFTNPPVSNFWMIKCESGLNAKFGYNKSAILGTVLIYDETAYPEKWMKRIDDGTLDKDTETEKDKELEKVE